jgi:hypothetical protein
MDALEARHRQALSTLVVALAAVRPGEAGAHHVGADVAAIGAAHGQGRAVGVLAAILAIDGASARQLLEMLGGGAAGVPVAYARRVADRHDEAPQAIGPAADGEQAAVLDDLRTGAGCQGEAQAETEARDERAEEASVWRYLKTGGAESSVGGAWISILILVGSTVEGASRK